MSRLKIYYQSYCPYCQMALKLAREMNLDYEAIDGGEFHDQLNEIKQKTGHRTIPIILLDDQLIGGYTEMAELANRDGLKDLIKT